MAGRVMDISGEHTCVTFFPETDEQGRLSLLCGRAAVITPRGVINGTAAAGLLEGLEYKNRRRILLRGEAEVTQEGMDALGELGVCLRGSEGKLAFEGDTGSADALSRGSGRAAILEGLDLTDAPDGLYELHALPLKKDAAGRSLAGAVLEPCRKAYKMTTLCYIRKGDSYLMLYRNRKENDENEGKWIGIGGKVEEGETPEQCVRREVFEETGLTLLEYSFRGIVTFVNDVWDNEYMMLYEGTAFSGELRSECDEGELAWIPFDRIMDLPLWEGDRVFLRKLIGGEADAGCRLEYQGDHLISAL